MDIAVYIDADNVSWKSAQRVREIVQRIGTIRKAIAIGEKQRFRGKCGWHTTSWVSPCPVCTIGKKANAADFEMTIRMGEDVASRKFDAFCIVADDNDYITAAERLRARGKRVFGIGCGKAPSAYRKVLNGYFDLTATTTVDGQKETLPVAVQKNGVQNPKGDLDGYCDRCLTSECKIGCVHPEYGTRYCQWALAAAGYYYRHAGCSYIADGFWKRVVGTICGTDRLKDRQREEIKRWVVDQDRRSLYRDFIEFAREYAGGAMTRVVSYKGPKPKSSRERRAAKNGK